MPAATITFIGAKETGTDALTWGPDITLPAGKPVLIDTDEAKTSEARVLYEHLLSVAPTHPHFKVEEVKGKKVKAKAAEASQPAEDDYPEEPTNGDLDAEYYDLPKDWKDLHHKKLIALAKRLGGEGDALATRDGAIEYIEERVTLEGNRLHLEQHDA
jgi:hypothetical protein